MLSPDAVESDGSNFMLNIPPPPKKMVVAIIKEYRINGCPHMVAMSSYTRHTSIILWTFLLDLTETNELLLVSLNHHANNGVSMRLRINASLFTPKRETVNVPRPYVNVTERSIVLTRAFSGKDVQTLCVQVARTAIASISRCAAWKGAWE